MSRSGDNMEQYLDELEDLSRKLANMNAIISDGEMGNVILQGVESAHRNVVRLFNSPSMVGAGNLEPNLDVALNTLRGEAEMDKCITYHVKSDDEQPVKAIQTKPCDNQQTQKKPPAGGPSGSRCHSGRNGSKNSDLLLLQQEGSSPFSVLRL
ncbi:hypothetical protein PC129_g13673 [Phytophthora cactorum]|uniref:Uncharacterized protein n=1 Tax=Phytophthora cactorum TaxID=29920 RepID=A0A329RT29_9STRA|nr:hypothetical protein Pcac1_g27123 [Phytophthora cactorum]KAG2809712.1 hypothetical protein PC112_g16383 [Phytophthora cactorum]KAG2811951.1 hypothetical protein PC111_g15014 [Phytophthora cactorum]KAG2850921.1 hypothetical protein PC113_g16349 [Phytophthora cactorum]KAG2889647.1 hypothetical protein PC114_g17860 [Phytophthora cactorum]